MFRKEMNEMADQWKKIDAAQKVKYEFLHRLRFCIWQGYILKILRGTGFTILTRKAEECMTGVLHRMPVILHKEDLRNRKYVVILQAENADAGIKGISGIRRKNIQKIFRKERLTEIKERVGDKRALPKI